MAHHQKNRWTVMKDWPVTDTVGFTLATGEAICITVGEMHRIAEEAGYTKNDRSWNELGGWSTVSPRHKVRIATIRAALSVTVGDD